MLFLTQNVDCKVCLSKHQKVVVMRVPCHCLAETLHMMYPQHLRSRKGCETRLLPSSACWTCCTYRLRSQLKLPSQAGLEHAK